jgi:hypothetical protein
MDKTLIYGLFETLTVSAAGLVYRLPADTLNRKILKIYFLLKINEIFLKKDYWYQLPVNRLSAGN